MVNKLTGKETSNEMHSVLDRLARDESVPLDEINEIPEIKLAYSCLNRSTDTINLKNREDLQENIKNEMISRGSVVYDDNMALFTGVIKKEHRADIVIGLPAAGKSSAIVEPLSREFNSRVIDSDEVKKMIPEYNNGWGAGVVHKESKLINEQVLKETVKRGENLVLPLVGSDSSKMESIVNLLKAFDYKVFVHYNELSPNKALGRLLNRFIEDGRFLDPKLIYGYKNNVEEVYENLKRKEGLLDGYSKFNNDVKRGERPRVIETTCKGRTWDNVIGSNERDAGRLRGLHSEGPSGRTDREERGRKEAEKLIYKFGYKPTEKLINCMTKLSSQIGKCGLKIGAIKKLAKESTGKTKGIATELFKELEKQDKIQNHQL